MRVGEFSRLDVVRLIWNYFLAYLCYMICRVVFLLENWDMFGHDLSGTLLWNVFLGGLRFDTSAICYTNAIVLLLYLFPLHYKETHKFGVVTKCAFVVINSIAILLNLCDAVFFEYRRQRISTATFREFSNEGNLLEIFFLELVANWYLVLIAVAMIVMLWKLYLMPTSGKQSLKRYYIGHSVAFVLLAVLSVMGMRGSSFFSATRPIAVSYSHKYVDNPLQTGIVLNTPFTIIRTIGQLPPEVPVYFKTQAELDSIYTPVHIPVSAQPVNKRNIVILIVESFSTEFIGGMNKGLDGGAYKGYTPFIDGLLEKSMWFEHSFANGAFSIDAPPAVLAAIPRMERPFVLSPYSLNHLNSIASELGKWNYHTAFFHGADNESLGINAFVKSIGFKNYYGEDEYYADTRFGGKNDFDGHWGVWDEPFLQFFCAKISEMPQPFVATVFTLSSHHPFAVPDKYEHIFVDEGRHELHKCIRYTDFAIKRFFESASRQPWFENTIFVITADHASSKRTHDVYKTGIGDFKVPIIFYDPAGTLPVGCQKGVAQQTDIMPTLLTFLGYDSQYVAFGKDVLNASPSEMWAFNWGLYTQYIKGDYIMLFDGENVSAVYNYVEDPMLRNNLKGKYSRQEEMEREVKAIIQSYMQRATNDEMSFTK